MKFLFILCIQFLIFFHIFSDGTIDVSNPDRARSFVVKKAKEYLGTVYKYGGVSHKGVDCSGLAYAVYLELYKVKIPRATTVLYNYGEVVERKNLLPGDLVFFDTTGGISHVGIYIGENNIIHAASAGPNTGVITSSLSEKYYNTRYVGSRRLIINDDYDQELKKEEISLVLLKGRWKADNGFKFVHINEEGKGTAILENRVVMKIQVRIDENSRIIIEQAEPSNSEFFFGIVEEEEAHILTKATLPIRWIFNFNKKQKKLHGEMEIIKFSMEDGIVISMDSSLSRKSVWKQD